MGFFVGGASLGDKLGDGDYRLGFYRFASDLKAARSEAASARMEICGSWITINR